MKRSKRNHSSCGAAATGQLRRWEAMGYGGTAPAFFRGEAQLYRSIRESVPLIDACIYKIIRLCGGVSAECPDKAVERKLNEFLEHVPTGRGQQSLQTFLDQYLDSMLVYGRGIGEIVPTSDGRDIAAVLCGEPDSITVQEGSSPLSFAICQEDDRGRALPLPHQERLLFTPFQPEAHNPYGVSLLRSMPFLTELLGKIYRAIGSNWERMGNVRFAVVYRPQQGETDSCSAQEQSRILAEEWSRAMAATRDGSVRDFVAVGDVDVKVIGADNQILDSAVPVRQILEQLIAKTGIPPFMLGLSWSSTERMSAQQADLLTTEMTAIRRTLTPVVDRICRMWLRLHGYGCPVTVRWDDMSLQDLIEETQSALYREETRQLAMENDRLEREQAVRGPDR